MRTVEELAKFIEKEIGYDASVCNEYTCKKCGYHHEEFNHWIDHKSALAGNVVAFLGFKRGALASAINESIYRCIDNYWTPNGKAKEDALALAKEILEGLE